MRNKRYFRENENQSPVIYVRPNYKSIRQFNVFLDESKPSLKIDFSKFKNEAEIERVIYNYFFLGQEDIQLNETYDLVIVEESENLGNVYDYNGDIYASDISTILMLFKEISKSDMAWSDLIQALVQVRGDKQDVSDLQYVYDMYEGYYVSPYDYMRNNGIYAVESNHGYLFFNTNK
jgi:hypothetical protein